MSELIYIVTTDISPSYTKEFNAWQENERCSFLLTIDGFHGVCRYQDLDVPHRFLNVWYIESIETYNKPERMRKAFTPWGDWLSPYRNRWTEFFYEDNGQFIVPPCVGLKSHHMIWVHTLTDSTQLNYYTADYFGRVCSVPGVVATKVYRAFGDGARCFAQVFHYIAGETEDTCASIILAIKDLFSIYPPEIITHRWRLFSRHNGADYCKGELFPPARFDTKI